MGSEKHNNPNPHDIANAPFEDEVVETTEEDAAAMDDNLAVSEEETGEEEEHWADSSSADEVDEEADSLSLDMENLENLAWDFEAAVSDLQNEEFGWAEEADEGAETAEEADAQADQQAAASDQEELEEFFISRENLNTLCLSLPSYPWFSG